MKCYVSANERNTAFVTYFRDDAKISERSFGVAFFNFFLSSLASSTRDFAVVS